MANMYAQLTQQPSKEASTVKVVEASPSFEKAKREEMILQDGKKGWQSVSNEFGGSSFAAGRSPGSASHQATRKATTPHVSN